MAEYKLSKDEDVAGDADADVEAVPEEPADYNDNKQPQPPPRACFAAFATRLTT